jgi:hypothetical protein
LLRVWLCSFCFNQIDLRTETMGLGCYEKVQRTDVETARIWFRDLSPTCFFDFFRLNMSPYVHAFAVWNRYAPSSFLYMLECWSAVWVCAQSRDVFITACMTMENWLCSELIRTYMFYMAEMALRRGFDQPYSYMHA